MVFVNFFAYTAVGVSVATGDSGEEKFVGLFPTVVPLPYGHSVVPGALADDAVLAKLAATHAFLGLLGKVLRTRVASGTATMAMDNWNVALTAGTVPAGMAQWYPLVAIVEPTTSSVPPATPLARRETLWLEAAKARIAPFVRSGSWSVNSALTEDPPMGPPPRSLRLWGVWCLSPFRVSVARAAALRARLGAGSSSQLMSGFAPRCAVPVSRVFSG